MSDQRWAPGACVLADGKHSVIAGGYSYAKEQCISTIDIYDKRTNLFHPSRARLPIPGDFVQSSLLPDGRVLFCGGYNDFWASMSLAEIYDPKTDRLKSCGGMNQHREVFQATTLNNGQILITGGLDLWARTTVPTCELFDPTTEKFVLTGSMNADCFGHAACKLADGRVLVVGGTHWNLHKHESVVLDSAEIYDPVSARFHETKGKLNTARDRPTATLLTNGKVLIYGGQGVGGKAVTTAEIFDPQTESFITIPDSPQIPRMAHSASSNGYGHIVITGGWDASSASTTATALCYDEASNQFIPLPNLPFDSHDAAQVVFPDGLVLVAGGKTAATRKEGSIDQGAIIKIPNTTVYSQSGH